jgi:hypothetical protein
MSCLMSRICTNQFGLTRTEAAKKFLYGWERRREADKEPLFSFSSFFCLLRTCTETGTAHLRPAAGLPRRPALRAREGASHRRVSGSPSQRPVKRKEHCQWQVAVGDQQESDCISKGEGAAPGPLEGPGAGGPGGKQRVHGAHTDGALAESRLPQPAYWAHSG